MNLINQDINKKNAIFFCIDDNYLYPLLFSIYGIKISSENDYKLVITYDPAELSNKSRELIQRFGLTLNLDVSFLELNLFDLNTTTDHISRTAFLKCMILTLPNIPERFLISDVDVLYRKGWESIWTLVQSENNENFLTVCPDRQQINLLSDNLSIRQARDFYFNSGIIMVNSISRPSDFSQNVLHDVLSRYRELGFEWKDQCVLNYLLTGYKSELPEKFNHFVAYPEDDHQGLILHFVGGVKKPWTLPLNPLRRFFYINTNMVKGAYARYYFSEILFLCRLLIESPTLLFRIEGERNRCVREANKLMYYYKARIRRMLRI